MGSKLLFALLISVLLASFAFAQDSSSQNQSNAADRLQKMAQELNLTDAQKEKIKPIVEDEAKQLQALRDDSSLSRRQKMSKFKAIHSQSASQIRPLLTPDQQKKLDQMKEETKQQMRQRRQHGGSQ